MKTLLFALTTIVNAQRYCNVVSDCPIGQQCVNFGFGGRICQMSAVGQGAQPSLVGLEDPWIACYSDADCARLGAGRCVIIDGRRRCNGVTVGSIGLPGVGGSNSPCTRDSDCQQGLQCVNNNGILRCQAVVGGLIGGQTGSPCRADTDCLQGFKCIYNYQTYSAQCQVPIDGSGGPTVGGIIGGSPLPTPATFVGQRECYADYHCQLGETCTGSGQIEFYSESGQSPTRFCRADPNAYSRQCIYHSDCSSGQLCLRNISSIFVCTFTPLATGGRLTCQYDYECPGGDRCVNVAVGIGAGAASFRCRPPTMQFRDYATRGQYCSTNADCAFQQVCQNTGLRNQCVDVDYLAQKFGQL